MLIGDIVKLKPFVIRNSEYREFVENGIKEGWISLVSGVDDKNSGCITQPLHSYDKSYRIEQAIGMLRNNNELIFEIRSDKEKDIWYEHMLLICVQGVTGNYALQYFLKPNKGVTPYKWKIENHIPFSEKIKWYISPLTDVQNSINEMGWRNS